MLRDILLVAPVRGDEEDVATKLNVIHLALTCPQKLSQNFQTGGFLLNLVMTMSYVPSRGGEIFMESKYTKNPETSRH